MYGMQNNIQLCSHKYYMCSYVITVILLLSKVPTFPKRAVLVAISVMNMYYLNHINN